MGGAIGARLVTTGTLLTVFDLDPAKVAALTDLGATTVSSAAAAAQGAHTVILSLNAPRIVRCAAVFGLGGVAEGASRGTLIIDMSLIDPEATKALAEDAKAKGLLGRQPPLRRHPQSRDRGTDPDAGRRARRRGRKRKPCWQRSPPTRLGGGPGAGQTTKLINQVLCGLNFMAVAEATALAEAAGVDADNDPGKVLRGGRADSAILQEYMPRLPPETIAARAGSTTWSRT